ncbi:MAG TPA: HD domain-containing protein [Longimicrobiales bacterium]|nr:HD domain-containing protein [Longimicrobiales bacterium]
MIASEKPHALVLAAADGRLPEWAVAGPERRAHMGRVAGLLDAWAEELGLPQADRARWRAAGWLHDALRDEDADALRPLVPERFRSLPGQILHGPAAAACLADEGVTDEELLQAVTFHTIGHAGLGALGRALYAADFLEPGRTFLNEWRGELRSRLPEELDAVLVEIVRARLEHLADRTTSVLPETRDFWNALVAEGR